MGPKTTQVPAQLTKLDLNCLVLGDDPCRIFNVKIDGNLKVSALKRAIKNEKSPDLDIVPADALDVFKVSLPVDDDLHAILQNFQPEDNPKHGVHSLSLPLKRLNTFFGDLEDEHIHVIVLRPSIRKRGMDDSFVDEGKGKQRHLDSVSHEYASSLRSPRESNRSVEDSGAYKQRHKSSYFSSPPSNCCPRRMTVTALYERVMQYSFVRVCGTPASGKTTLSQLFCEYVVQQGKHAIWIGQWPLRTVQSDGGFLNYLYNEFDWDQKDDEDTVFVFDEAQTSYQDVDLWNQFFKSIHGYPKRCAVVFACYGGPTFDPNLAIIPMLFADAQLVTLRPIPHDDGLPSVGLFLCREEFDDLVSRTYPQPLYYFHPSFFDRVYEITAGHVGAISDFVKVVSTHSSYHRLKSNITLPYTWDFFLQSISPLEFLSLLRKSANIFRRGLPGDEDLRKLPLASVFRIALRDGLVVESKVAAEDRDALQECFRQGWLHADTLRDARGLEQGDGYFFTTELHRWYVEWRLAFHTPPPPSSLHSDDIRTFVFKVISQFSPVLLACDRRMGPGCIPRPLEAQYHDEFYRCCHCLSGGSVVSFPEFGTGKGQVDFYIPAKQWGVELLREGNRITEQFGRFSPNSPYATMLNLSDYIVLDFRISHPRKPFPDVPKLYHVILNNNFREVSILNNMLQKVDEFTLLHL